METEAVAMTKRVEKLPVGFVYLEQVDPTIIQDVRYATANNIVGRPIKGYEVPRCILTEQAAQKLAEVQSELRKQSLGLKVFDCYRPQMAVDDFDAWSQDADDQSTKQQYYPNIDKADLFKLGYIMKRSGHTRGSTVDLTLVNLADKSELPMGTHFDFMDETSYPTNKTIGPIAYGNRMILRNIMIKHGFTPLATEWWHFTLKDEPYKDMYFNFPVR